MFEVRSKRQDYEHNAIAEYWLVDPQKERFTFYRLEGGRYTEARVRGSRFESRAVPGFSLDLVALCKKFHSH
ncbi:MAG: hypothetical protein AMXMBFR13_44260 [Phycisphaerae bacterium]